MASEVKRLWTFFKGELRPKGKIITPFNIITGLIIALAGVLLVYRFANGLGAVGDHHNPWGLWIGFNVITGVAMAGGAFVVTFLVYVMGINKYHTIVRSTVLYGFLAYMFYAGALMVDLGRPWNLVNPIIGNDFGFSSVLFLVAWHFLLYMVAQALEFSPAVAEWAKLKKIHRILSKLTVGAVVFGITLSLLHQSGLGALFLMAKPKIHPLWYSEYIPIQFLVSSVFAGLSIVIVESSISSRIFAKQTDEHHKKALPGITLGLARICVGAMFVYLFLVTLIFLHGQRWNYMGDGYFYWYLVEIVGFVLLPMLAFAQGIAARNLNWIRAAAAVSIVGIIINRLNISIITFKWYEAVRYIPSWMEIVIAIAVICVQLWVFRWISLRMPVRTAPPAWVHEKEPETATDKATEMKTTYA